MFWLYRAERICISVIKTVKYFSNTPKHCYILFIVLRILYIDSLLADLELLAIEAVLDIVFAPGNRSVVKTNRFDGSAAIDRYKYNNRLVSKRLDNSRYCWAGSTAVRSKLRQYRLKYCFCWKYILTGQTVENRYSSNIYSTVFPESNFWSVV